MKIASIKKLTNQLNKELLYRSTHQLERSNFRTESLHSLWCQTTDLLNHRKTVKLLPLPFYLFTITCWCVEVYWSLCPNMMQVWLIQRGLRSIVAYHFDITLLEKELWQPNFSCTFHLLLSPNRSTSNSIDKQTPYKSWKHQNHSNNA